MHNNFQPTANDYVLMLEGAGWSENRKLEERQKDGGREGGKNERGGMIEMEVQRVKRTRGGG